MVKKEKYLIRHLEDAPTFETPNKHDDRPDEAGSYTLTTILGDEANMPVHGDPTDSDNFHYVHITHLPVGAAVGEHPHTGNEQFYLVTSGQAEITLCGDKYQAGPWTIALIKDGGSHGIRNVGTETLTYICCEIEISKK